MKLEKKNQLINLYFQTAFKDLEGYKIPNTKN